MGSDSDMEYCPHMIKPTSTIHTQAFRNTRAHPRPLCVALRLWGFEESEVLSWIREWPDLGGAITWTIARDRVAHGAGVVVHLVKSSRRAAADFCWNCAGANYALAKSRAECGVEMVLFSGAVDQLPLSRSGHWATAGTLSPQIALHRLGCLIAAASMRDSRGAMRVRNDLITMITRQLDVA
jgi:hypothetical protein